MTTSLSLLTKLEADVRAGCVRARRHVVISFTSTPQRLPLLQPMLLSLLRQEQAQAEVTVVVCLPQFCAQTGEAYPTDLPIWLAAHVERCTSDHGPITKLIPAIALATRLGAEWVLTVDDDVVYPPALVRCLVEASDSWPDAAVGCSGLCRLSARGDSGLNLAPQTVHGGEASVLEGFAGVLYRASFFAADFMPYAVAAAEQPLARLSDDLVVALYLEHHNVPRRVVSCGAVSRATMVSSGLPHGSSADALHCGGGGKGNNYRRYNQVALKINRGELPGGHGHGWRLTTRTLIR